MNFKSLLNFALSAAVAASFMVAMPGAANAGDVKLTGSGASFPYPIYDQWTKDFSKASGVKVTYQSKGSSAGVKDVINHVVDFGASDAAMTPEKMAQVPEGVQLLPMTAGEVVLAYNLPGVKKLQLPRDVYPKIFLGQVTKWNDPLIAAANPGAKLPDLGIVVIVRADKSGTTFAFTGHLSAISSEFKSTVGQSKMPQWPEVKGMLKGKKNDGVAANIGQTPGAIGYVEYGYAKFNKLAVTCLENKAGKFICPGPEGGAAALAKAKLPDDMIVFITDPEGEKSYPIATFTWMIFYKKNKDAATAAALRKWVEYGLDEGQKIADKFGYIPLPADVVTKVRAASKNIQ